ncbi:tricarballylate utilization 4Fe-4S protein TcuB [Sphingomonas sp.]|uniref:tricarballylate utilization 4Fe-4S protein TcuB n=1 Tax=Sphingomonas sp. TaxID=28214 RepID=UPI000DB8BEFF|nr:tricarballylate utilization 4Fe-4S protein TcuB [Sphingomonas sp.]PZU06492.1 MAG: tricarballylate utilization 4Fe-4S protein TcuB [Sphingomonas sp.]
MSVPDLAAMARGEPMLGEEILSEAKRQMEVCNACRYCEGFCAVFPAMALRREFTSGDLTYLANLCHNCKGCFYACQYAPPHPFGVNVPATFAQVRQDSYQRYAWPGAFARAYERQGTALTGLAALGVAAILLLTGAIHGGNMFTPQSGTGAFYRILPWAVMAGLAGAAFLFALLALTVAGVRFWRDTASGGGYKPADGVRAGVNVATLRYLGGGHEGHDGCNDTDGGFSQQRRVYHHFMFYGFLACFASTSVATIYDHFLAWEAPYPLLSLPVLLGLVGGIGLLIGTTGLIVLKAIADPAPVAQRLRSGEYALLFLLQQVALTGLLLLALRETAALGVLVAVHLGLVLAFFLAIPYSKMVHGLYRGLALLRSAREQRTGSTLAGGVA